MKKILTDCYTIKNKKVNKKILVISDIHYYSKKDSKRLNNLLEYLRDYKCDYILIPGDFINEAHVFDEEILLDFLTSIAIIPVIISLGNHDTIILKQKRAYYKNEDLFNKIKKVKNIHLLDNTVYETDGIRFMGLTLPTDYYRYHENKNYFIRYLNNNFDTPDTNLYNIILCHSPRCLVDPDIIKEVRLFDNANLIVSGHMHAGLAPKFLRNTLKGKGIIDPNYKFFPKKCYGKYNIFNKDIIISAGIIKFSHNTIFRIFNFLFHPELCLIELYKKKNK